MEERISCALPYLEEEFIVQIQQHLAVLGMRTIEDIELINGNYLNPVLAVVDSRRRLRAFQRGNIYIFAFLNSS